MNKIDILKESYKGNSAWRNFVLAYGAPKSLLNINNSNSLGIDDDILFVLEKKLGNLSRVERWLNKKIPALEGETAFSLFKRNRKNGREVLRSLIMRMP